LTGVPVIEILIVLKPRMIEPVECGICGGFCGLLLRAIGTRDGDPVAGEYKYVGVQNFEPLHIPRRFLIPCVRGHNLNV